MISLNKDYLIYNLKECGYSTTNNVQDIIYKTGISFVCVNTPHDNNNRGEQDILQVMSVLLANTLNNSTNKQ